MLKKQEKGKILTHSKSIMSLQSACLYFVEYTADGSPTLRLTSHAAQNDHTSDDTGEAMHHSGGAMSESLYLYYENIKAAWGLSNSLKANKTPLLNILSVGLGLGYNEMLAAAFSIQNKNIADRLKLHSYEIDPFLRESFIAWIHKSSLLTSSAQETQRLTVQTPEDLFAIYDQILLSIGHHFAGSPLEIKDQLKKWHDKKSLKFFGDIRISLSINNLTDQERYNSVLFDAFSSKTNSALWTEAFLDQFIHNNCASFCILSTYAATGILKRTLKKHRFDVILRQGFKGKRQSTWAVRTLTLDLDSEKI